jgi:flagellar secretion chaperone FliS
MTTVHRNPWQSYRQVATQTATPGQLVLMLFDGAIRFLERARQGFSQDDPLEFNQTINNNVLRAQAIINELNLALDLDKGGDVAITLRRLYNYMDQRLQEANQYKKEDGILEVVRRLTILRDAWAEMLQTNGAGHLPDISLAVAG